MDKNEIYERLRQKKIDEENRRAMVRKCKITIVKKNKEISTAIIIEYQIIESIRFLALRFEDDSIAFENLDEVDSFKIDVLE